MGSEILIFALMAKFRPNVALLLIDQEGRLLICERAKFQGAWQFPQGGVDEGETVEEALFREVEEEIGLPAECYRIMEVKGGYRYRYPEYVKKKKKGRYDGQEQTYYLCRLDPEAPPIDITRQPQEFRSCRWIAPSEFDLSWLPDFKCEVYRQVMKDFFGVVL